MIKVKQEEIDPDECDRDGEETRRWVVCSGGVLKEVKVEHSTSVSDTCAGVDCGEDVDLKQQRNSTDDKNMNEAQSSYLKVPKMAHIGEKPYTCDTCGKSYTKSWNLKSHKRIHTGEKPYTCDTCGKSFTTLTTLRVHERIHTGEKPYTCDTCGKLFTTLTTLRVHKRIHTGEKPYRCNTCGKSFTQFNGLKSHERIHTSEKPYMCDTCRKSFAQSFTLTASAGSIPGFVRYRSIPEFCSILDTYVVIMSNFHTENSSQ